MADESQNNASSEPDDSGEAGSAADTGDGDREGGDRSVKTELGILETVLTKTRRRLRRPVLVEGGLWWATTVAAVLVVSLLLAAFIPEHGYGIARWTMAVGIGSATVGGLAALGYFVWRPDDLEHVATRIQRHHSEFRSDLVAALEFGRALADDGGSTLEERGVSPAMARAHLGRTVDRVDEQSRDGALDHCVPTRDLTPPIMAVSAAVAVLLIPLIFNPGWTLGVLSGERLGAPVVGERTVEETIVGSVEGVFVYPSYTGMERQRRDLGTGRIESLEGTEVHLHTTLMPGDWADVEMVVETGDADPEVVDMTLDGGHRATATIELDESGHYWFRGETVEGRPVEEPARRPIEVRQDQPPSIDIVSHDGRVAVEPDDVVEFEIVASDDYGIESIDKVHHFQGAGDDPERADVAIEGLEDQPTEVEETVELDLRPLELRPKDAINVYFEARDINTATGPGVTDSDPVVLYVESPEDRHMENIADQQEILEALVDHMADVLEAPVGDRHRRDDGTWGQDVDGQLADEEVHSRYQRARTLNRHRDRLVDGIDDVAEQLEDDPMMVPRNLTLFQGIGDRLEGLYDEGEALFEQFDDDADRRDLSGGDIQEVADFQAGAEAELEASVLRLEELLVDQKTDLVEETADQIDEMRDRLRDLLEQYRETDDPELREAIEREIDRLRQRMQELMSRMQMQMREMPQEHVNLEAMEDMEMESDADDLGAQLDSVEEMLDNDDIDGALDALDEMEGQLDSMTGEMEQSFSQMQSGGISEFDEAVGEMMDEATHLQEMQAELEEETSELQDELREERQQQLDEMLGPVVEELMEMIRAQHRGLEVLEDRPLSERDLQEVDDAARAQEALEEMVRQEDMAEALERARDARRALETMRSTMTLSQRYADNDSAERRAIDESLDDGVELIERAEDIEERIEEFIARAQEDLADDEEQRFDELADDQQEIRERASELREEIEEEGQQHPQLQEQLQPSVEGAEEAMEEAVQQLDDRQIQRALDEERQALEHLGELGDSMGEALQQQRQQEREESGHPQRAEDEEVEIPGEQGGEARERIREEMMEGMRDGRIEDYESEIERYFRSLVE